MIYLVGFILVIAARIIYAGMKTDELLYRGPKNYEITLGDKKKTDRVLDGEKLAGYIFSTAGLAIAWPLLLPAVGLFLIGRKYANHSRK